MKQVAFVSDRTLSTVHRARKDYDCWGGGFCLGTRIIKAGEEYVRHAVPPGHDTLGNITWTVGRYCNVCTSIPGIREEQQKAEERRRAPRKKTATVAGRTVTYPTGPGAEKCEWTQDELATEARRRFGDDIMQWSFVCPNCGDVASFADFQAAGANPNSCGQVCIGRYLGALARDAKRGRDGIVRGTRGCDWSANGLFCGPWTIILPAEGDEKPERRTFAFRLAPGIQEQSQAAAA